MKKASVWFIMASYRPGSQHDDWSWADEFEDILRRDHGDIAELVSSIRANGIQTPVMLGWDGRVWDGHHRILAAHILGIRRVPYVKAKQASEVAL